MQLRVRPVSAAQRAAGHSALRGSGPAQQLAFDDALAHLSCPIAGSTGSALHSFALPNCHIPRGCTKPIQGAGIALEILHVLVLGLWRDTEFPRDVDLDGVLGMIRLVLSDKRQHLRKGISK
jgi:hypothetical protein